MIQFLLPLLLICSFFLLSTGNPKKGALQKKRTLTSKSNTVLPVMPKPVVRERSNSETDLSPLKLPDNLRFLSPFNDASIEVEESYKKYEYEGLSQNQINELKKLWIPGRPEELFELLPAANKELFLAIFHNDPSSVQECLENVNENFNINLPEAYHRNTPVMFALINLMGRKNVPEEYTNALAILEKLLERENLDLKTHNEFGYTVEFLLQYLQGPQSESVIKKIETELEKQHKDS